MSVSKGRLGVNRYDPKDVGVSRFESNPVPQRDQGWALERDTLESPMLSTKSWAPKGCPVPFFS